MARDTPATARSRGEQTRLIAAGVAGVLIVLFCVLNTQRVQIHWIVTTTATPLIVAMVVCLGLGAIAGYWIARTRSKRSTR